MSWLIVAKMPLLISSRITSAGLTASSSASSLTVIVAGSSIAPRSRGSATWTCDCAPVSRRGGLRGPRLPRVPLLLLATLSSFSIQHRRPRQKHLAELRRNRSLERPPQGTSLDGSGPAACVPTEVRTPAGKPAGLIDLHLAARRPNDPDEVAFRPRRPAGHARPRRSSPRGDRPPRPARTPLTGLRSGALRCARSDVYDATSPA